MTIQKPDSPVFGSLLYLETMLKEKELSESQPRSVVAAKNIQYRVLIIFRTLLISVVVALHWMPLSSQDLSL